MDIAPIDTGDDYLLEVSIMACNLTLSIPVEALSTGRPGSSWIWESISGVEPPRIFSPKKPNESPSGKNRRPLTYQGLMALFNGILHPSTKEKE